jgi:hypothetical protein
MADGGARWRVRVRARKDRGQVFIGAGGRLGASEVMTVTHSRVERSWHGRRHARFRRLMARHERCAGLWIDTTWRGPLATDGTGELPPAQRSDQQSLRRLGVRAQRGYGAYGILPTWPHTTSRQGASRRSRAFAIRCCCFQIKISPDFQTKVHLTIYSKVEDHTSLYNFHKGW